MGTPTSSFWYWPLTLVSYLTMSGVLASISSAALAQIIPDTTLGSERTVFTPKVNVNGLSGDRIDGGAKRGVNLFHSFLQFNVDEGGRVYFANPSGIENIISRVTGKAPSNILGTLGVLGNANLFLLNPNGIVFGPNAQLDVRGSFVASTANSLKFPDGYFFSATNPTAPPLLSVNVPIGLQFGTPQPAPIVNAGQLSVSAGQNLSLLGGTVVSTGELAAPGGQLTVASIPGYSEVQLNPSGQPLSLSPIPNPQPSTVNPSSLSQLLKGVESGLDLGMTRSGSDEVKLAGSDLKLTDGDVVVRQLRSNQATLSATHNLTLVESQLNATGNLNLLAQNTVLVRDSSRMPFVAQAGGKLLVQGNYIDIFALNHPESGFFSGADMVFRSPSAVGGDARYSTGGNFRIELPNGSLGNLFSPNDPVIRASGDVSFGSYQGASLHIFAGGSVTIPGVVAIGAADPVNGIADSVQLSNGTILSINGSTQSTLDVRAGTTGFGSPGITGAFPPLGAFIPQPPNPSGTPTSANINIGSIINSGGVVFLTNQYKPNLSLPGGAINIPGTITTGSQSGNGGSVIIDSRSTIVLKDTLNASSAVGRGGDITLLGNGDVTTSNISSIGLLGGNINLTSNGKISLNDSLILSASFTPVPGLRGGDINVKTGSLTLTNGARMITFTLGAAQGGNVNVTGEDSIELSGTQGSSTLLDTLSATIPQLKAFLATLPPDEVEALRQADGSPLKSPASSLLAITAAGTGASGNVRVETGRVSVRDGSEISAYSFGNGAGGNVTVKAADAVELIGTTQKNIPGGLYTQSYGTGNAGDISIDTGRLTVRDGSGVSTTTFSQSHGGNLTVNAGDLVELSGTTPDAQYPSLLGAGSRNSGDAGNLTLNARRLIIRDGAGVGTTTFSEGKGGNLTVNATESVELIGVAAINGIPGGLSADTLGTGNAGSMRINTKRLTVRDGAVVSASTFASGQGGSLVVNAGESVELSGRSATGIPSGLYAQGFATGNAGNLEVQTEQLSVRNGAKVTVSTGTTQDDLARFISGTYGFGARLQVNFSNQATGNAGEMKIAAGSIQLDNQGSLIAKTASGEGGNISLQGRDLLLMRHNSQISATAGGTGNGGNLDINSQFIVVVPSENSDITANAVRGRGGNIDITTQGIYGLQFRPRLTPLSDITASSDFGVNGVVQINTLDVDPSKAIVALPETLVDVYGLVRQGCASSARQQASKFVVTGRGGLPSNPNETLRSRRVLVDLGGTNPQVSTVGAGLENHHWGKQTTIGQNPPSLGEQGSRGVGEIVNSTSHQHPNTSDAPIVEAQGWVVGSKGEIILTAQPSTVTSHGSWQTTPSCHMGNGDG